MNQQSASKRPGVEILTTGGTFDTESDGSIGPPRAAAVLEQARVTLPFSSLELMRLDSSVMQDGHRLKIRAAVVASACDRLVIVHGTDTLLQTADTLADVPGKVMVLTGSFVPADAPQGDAAFNLGASLLAAQLLPPGVHVVMGGECFRPSEIRKNTGLRRFERL